MLIRTLALVLFGAYHLLIMPIWDRYVANEHSIVQISNLPHRCQVLEAERPMLEARLVDIEPIEAGC